MCGRPWKTTDSASWVSPGSWKALKWSASVVKREPKTTGVCREVSLRHQQRDAAWCAGWNSYGQSYHLRHGHGRAGGRICFRGGVYLGGISMTQLDWFFAAVAILATPA